MIASFMLSLSALSACAVVDEHSPLPSADPECLVGAVSDAILLGSSCGESSQVLLGDAANERAPSESLAAAFLAGQGTPTLSINPATGLRDRAVVAVRGEGFDVNMRTNARLCRAGTTSPNDCLPAGRAPVTADDGGFYQEVIVYAGFGSMDGSWIDCAAPRSCELIVFSGRAPARAPLTFASGEAVPRPALRIAPGEPLSDQQAVRVRGSGFDRGASLSLQQYLVHDDGRGQWHELLSNVFVSADGRGEFERTVTVSAGPAGSGRDCVSARCVLAASELQGRYGSAQSTLRFVSGAARGSDRRAAPF